MSRSVLIVMSFCVLACDTTPATGQQKARSSVTYIGGLRPGRPYRYRGWHSPGTALSAQVHAQADMVRASGDAVVDFAAARRIRAEAVRAELDNSVARVRAYWDRRTISETERAKRRVDPEVRRRRNNSKTWQKLRLHPDLSAPKIVSGTAHNFLLYRLSATALTYDPSSPGPDFNSEVLTHFALTPDVLGKLRLQQSTGRSRFVFRADEGVPLKMNWWPYVLRHDEFQRPRAAFLSARQEVVRDASDGVISVGSLEALELASVDLSTEFRKRFDRRRRLQEGQKSFREAREAEVFLQSLDLEIARLQRTGDASAFDRSLRFDPAAEGSHLPALLAFMARNGLKFAPPQPGDESAYFQTFQLMRDFYLAYDDDDEGIKVPAEKKRGE